MSRAKSWSYTEQVLSRPARAVPVKLRHNKSGVTLLHRGRALTQCYDTGPGRVAADLVALALGVPLPPVGESVETAVSTGVLFRVVSLSSIDARVVEMRPLVQRLVEEAIDQRQAVAEDPM